MRRAAAAALLLLAGCGDGGADRAERLRAAGPNPNVTALLRVADARQGERLFRACAACHAIRKGAPDRNGPNLFGVVGAPVAGVSPRFGYTAALQRVGGTWTPERLDAWLKRPQAFAPGTSMGYPGLPDPLARADLIAYLRAQH